MTIYLSHSSALAYLRSSEFLLAYVDGVAREALGDDARATVDALAATGLVAAGHVPLPVHVMVGSEHAKRHNAAIVAHSCASRRSSLGRSFLRVGPELCVSDGKLTLMSLSPGLSVAKRTLLGMELCGTYSLDAGSERGFADRRPLATTSGIRAFLGRNAGAHGARCLRLVMPDILDGSASPLESKVVESLVLPSRLGGFNLPKPQLNARISNKDPCRRARDRQFFSVDMLWAGARLVIEVDSSSFHRTREQLKRDAVKRNTLVSMGYTVITVTGTQAYDFTELRRVARVIRKELGLHSEPSRPELDTRRLRLHNELFYGSGN